MSDISWNLHVVLKLEYDYPTYPNCFYAICHQDSIYKAFLPSEIFAHVSEIQCTSMPSCKICLNVKVSARSQDVWHFGFLKRTGCEKKVKQSSDGSVKLRIRTLVRAFLRGGCRGGARSHGITRAKVRHGAPGGEGREVGEHGGQQDLWGERGLRWRCEKLCD